MTNLCLGGVVQINLHIKIIFALTFVTPQLLREANQRGYLTCKNYLILSNWTVEYLSPAPFLFFFFFTRGSLMSQLTPFPYIALFNPRAQITCFRGFKKEKNEKSKAI